MEFEKMNLEDINSIFFYGTEIINEVTNRGMEIDRSIQDNSYVFNDDFEKLVSRVTTMNQDLEKDGINLEILENFNDFLKNHYDYKSPNNEENILLLKKVIKTTSQI